MKSMPFAAKLTKMPMPEVFKKALPKAMRKALDEGDYKAARKLVNGGSHGLDRFKDVFVLAPQVWPELEPDLEMAPARAGRSAPGRRARCRPAAARADAPRR